MINEDADISKSGSPWIESLKAQQSAGTVPELVIPGVRTNLRVVSMSSKKAPEKEISKKVKPSDSAGDERAKLLKLRDERRKRKHTKGID